MICVEHYFIFDYGLVLTRKEMYKLLLSYTKGIVGIEDNKAMRNVLEETDCSVVANEFLCNIVDMSYYSEFSGDFENIYLDNDKSKRCEKKFGKEEMFIFRLAKTDLVNDYILFNKYRDIDEIIDEIRDILEKLGLSCDSKFLRTHIGKVFGVYVKNV